MGNLLVSAVIPVYNRAGTILRAAESVLNQAYQPLELIVVDDGSTDRTAELLKPLAQAGQLNYIYQANQGVSAARNAGLKVARGSFIAFLDSDDEWLPGKIAGQVEYLLNNPDVWLVQGQERWVRGGVRVNVPRKYMKVGGYIFPQAVKLCAVAPSAVMIRKELFDEVGLFDASLPAAEDYDLWLRICHKYPVGLIDQEIIVKHGGRGDQLSNQHILDIYRIKALRKILAAGVLDEGQRQLAEDDCRRRENIYQAGLAKRLNQADH